MATNQNTKRKDKARVVLRKGESQRKDGKYDFRWTSPDGKRHSIYAATLEELREKEHSARFAGRHQGRSTVRHPERCVHPVGKGEAWSEGQHLSELSVPLSAVRGAGFRQIEGVCAQKVGCEAVLQHAGRRAGLADLHD